MNVMVDQVVRQKLLVVKNEKRVFTFEFPADSDVSELFGVVSLLKKEIWKAVEAETKEEDAEVEEVITKEDIDMIAEEVIVEMKK